MAGSENVLPAHLTEALQYRALDRLRWSLEGMR
jgi:hypothetical protein